MHRVELIVEVVVTQDRPVRVMHVLGRLTAAAGIQVVVRQLAAGVDPEEVELHIVTARPRIEEDQLEDVPAQIHPLGYTRNGYRLRDRLWTVWAVARQAWIIRPDVVHLHSGTAWMSLATRVLRPRAGFVLEVHAAPGSGHHGGATDRVEGWWVRFGGAVAVCHSRSVLEEVQRLWRPRPSRVTMFPLAVDTEVFRPRSPAERSAWRRHYGVPGDLPMMIVVGRLAESKRFDRAVDAVARLLESGESVGLVVVGRGAEETALRAQAVDLNIADQVWFTGPLYGPDLADAYGAADILCSPSEYEGFGLTIIEGMGCGLPAVAVAVGGVTDLVIDGETGSLVDPSDPGRFAEVTGRYVSDAALRATIGAAALERTRDLFGVERLVGSFTDLYFQLASRKRY